MSASVCTSNDDECKEGTQSAWVSSTATATVFVGAITGQLTVYDLLYDLPISNNKFKTYVYILDGLRW